MPEVDQMERSVERKQTMTEVHPLKMLLTQPSSFKTELTDVGHSYSVYTVKENKEQSLKNGSVQLVTARNSSLECYTRLRLPVSSSSEEECTIIKEVVPKKPIVHRVFHTTTTSRVLSDKYHAASSSVSHSSAPGGTKNLVTHTTTTTTTSRGRPSTVASATGLLSRPSAVPASRGRPSALRGVTGRLARTSAAAATCRGRPSTSGGATVALPRQPATGATPTPSTNPEDSARSTLRVEPRGAVVATTAAQSVTKVSQQASAARLQVVARRTRSEPRRSNRQFQSPSPAVSSWRQQGASAPPARKAPKKKTRSTAPTRRVMTRRRYAVEGCEYSPPSSDCELRDWPAEGMAERPVWPFDYTASMPRTIPPEQVAAHRHLLTAMAYAAYLGKIKEGKSPEAVLMELVRKGVVSRCWAPPPPSDALPDVLDAVRLCAVTRVSPEQRRHLTEHLCKLANDLCHSEVNRMLLRACHRYMDVCRLSSEDMSVYMDTIMPEDALGWLLENDLATPDESDVIG